MDQRIRFNRNGPIRHTTRNRYADLMSVARLQFEEPNFDEDFFLAANQIPKFIPSVDWVPLKFGPTDDEIAQMRKKQRNRSLAISVMTAGLVAAVAVIVAFHVTAREPARPAWIRQMGGVAVTSVSRTPSAASPAGSVLEYIRAEDGSTPEQACDFVAPADQLRCQTEFGAAPAGAVTLFLNYRLGYTVERGDQALVVLTGVVCIPGSHPECAPDGDPSARLTSGATFSTLYAQAVADHGRPADDNLIPCVRIGAKWFVAGSGQAA
jgi:hypothetical protein